METLIIKEHMWLHNFKDFVLFYPAHKECFINIDPPRSHRIDHSLV
ncbi:Uncharacterised protein [Klebsiella pneumoniae]|nr:Uncharacterised protein [Klebsiella pneumoniae]SVU30382.1 Uncharacterised protein [Klebsiella pneumoniae]SYT88600.1 Uncharacterised protein [Klebsiella pneumoniae]